MNGTVGIYVDIEGTRTLLRSSYADALTQITGLVEDIYDLGTRVYNSSKARIFAYQFGDGLFVQPDVDGKDVSEIL